MIPVRLTVTKELTIRLYADLYRHEFRCSLRRVPFKWIVLTLGVILIAGIFTESHFLVGIVVCAFIAGTIYFGRYITNYKLTIRKLIRTLDQQIRHPVYQYDFSFDETGIYFLEEGGESKIEWDELHSFTENGNVVYLFDKKSNVKEIFCEEVLGEEHFTDILILIRKRVVKRYAEHDEKTVDERVLDSSLDDYNN